MGARNSIDRPTVDTRSQHPVQGG